MSEEASAAAGNSSRNPRFSSSPAPRTVAPGGGATAGPALVSLGRAAFGAGSVVAGLPVSWCTGFGVAAGAAMLPNLGQPCASIARALGAVTATLRMKLVYASG